MPNEIFRARAIGNIKAAQQKSYEAKKVKHSGLQGRYREIATEELLRPFLPRRYGFATGKLVDANGRQSPELDLIVYDPLALPGLMYSDRDGLVPVESSLLAIEVKTTLRREEFDGALKQAAAVRQLRQARVARHVFPDKAEWTLVPSYVQSCLFAFDGPSIETVDDWMNEAASQPDHAPLPSVCVLGKGAALRAMLESRARVVQPTAEHDEVLEFIAHVDELIWQASESLARVTGCVMGRYLLTRELPEEDPHYY